MTRRELAGKTGLSIPFLCDVEHGRKNLHGGHISKIANALGIKIAKLALAAAEDVLRRHGFGAEILISEASAVSRVGEKSCFDPAWAGARRWTGPRASRRHRRPPG